MNVYIESNFVIEWALLQEEHRSCQSLIAACRAGQARLVLPAFCVAETYQTLGRRSQERNRLREELSRELHLLGRSKKYRRDVETIQDTGALLQKAGKEEMFRVNRALRSILRLAESIPINADILARSERFPDLSLQDAIVYSSVLYHVKTSPRGQACFLTRDRRAFQDRALQQPLANLGCKLFLDFADGWQYIAHEIGRA